MIASSELQPRTLPDQASLSQSACFAWEIIRRRADYRLDSRATRTPLVGAGGWPVELIVPRDLSNAFGLLFRGRSEPACVQSPHILGPQP